MYYNPKDKDSILEYAKKLQNKTLKDFVDPNGIDFKGKGRYGQFLEKYYFGYEVNSDARPDFEEAGIELKSSPLKQLSDKSYRAKERLVLNIINYVKLVQQEFCNSDFWYKNANLLLIFYLYQSEVSLFEYKIKLVGLWSFPAEDLEIIKSDWLKIRNKVIDGKAHELSEGDTFYLGACTKGATAVKSLREQPNSDILAKQRAFSLKQKYVNHIIANIAGKKKKGYGKIIDSLSTIANNKGSLESIVIAKFDKYMECPDLEIAKALNISFSKKPKHFHYLLTKAILGIDTTKEIEEFEKAEVIVKTVRLYKNNLPKEHISFPYFKYSEIVKQEWDESDFKDMLEHKFFFVFYQYDEEDRLILKKVQFWNMPQSDIIEAKKVWDKTIELINKGQIVKSIDENARRLTNFPKSSENRVSHVRPHAKDANDSVKLPIADTLTGEKFYTKHCFWLNKRYIRDEIFYK